MSGCGTCGNMMGSCFCGVDKEAFMKEFGVKPVDFSKGVRGPVRSITWYCYSGRMALGTVIAETEPEALKAAMDKWPGLGIESDPITVERRSNKRKK